MRQPATSSTTSATPSILQALVAAIPEPQLRELVLALLLDGASASAPAPTRRRRPVQPTGKRRGRPPKVKAITDTVKHAVDPKLVARRQRQAAARRAKRAADKANGGNGSKPAAPAQALWEHAERLNPGAPFKAVARELGVNSAVALDAFRNHGLPPGIGADAVARFLAVPAS